MFKKFFVKFIPVLFLLFVIFTISFVVACGSSNRVKLLLPDTPESSDEQEQVEAPIQVCLEGIDVCGVCGGNGKITWFQDLDLDNLGDKNNSIVVCESEKIDGYVLDDRDTEPDCATNNTDECGVCAGLGKVTYYEDSDGDGLGAPNSILKACTQPNGYVLNNTDDAIDCSTNNVDVCGICGGDGYTTWYEDVDSDNLGAGATQQACSKPVGYVSNNLDTEPNCSTNNTDSCGVCGGSGSDTCGVCGGSGPQTWYADADGDTLGDPNTTLVSCTQPTNPILYVLDNTDTQPNCVTNNTDSCGVCGGNNSNCVTDSELLSNTSLTQEEIDMLRLFNSLEISLIVGSDQ